MIALITDFGTDDIYLGSMKAAIWQRAPDVPIIDLTHAVPPHDIAAGAFALASALPYLPEGTVVVVVVDPGVGSRRRKLAVKVGGWIIVGPDNGLLTDVLWAHSEGDAVVLDAVDYWRTPEPSATFEGRDVFGPVAASLATGTPLSDVGTLLPDGLASLNAHSVLPRPARSGSSVIGHLRHVDRFGNIVTNITPALLPTASRFSVSFEEIRSLSVPLVKTYSDIEVGQVCLIVGSFGYVELSCRNASAAGLFPGLRMLSPITIKGVVK
jgi:S-adenosylmethionine hydrolase